MKSKTTFRILKSAVVLFFASIALLSVLAPVIQSLFGFPSGEGIYRLFSAICHQYPTRSLWIWDRPFALCSRCFSGYIGISLAAIVLSSTKAYYKRLVIGIALLMPGIMDATIQLVSEYESLNFTRSITGLLGGIGVFTMFYPLKLTKQKGRVKI